MKAKNPQKRSEKELWTVRNVYHVHDKRSKTSEKSRSRFKIEGSIVYYLFII